MQEALSEREDRLRAQASQYYGNIQANDHSRLHLGNNYYGNQERLKYAPGVVFNAYGLTHQACYLTARRVLLEEIDRWAKQSTDKSIFWLNGMAGTGKSTIAYTVAERLDRQRSSSCVHLGASFFFKRGEKDRASALLFFPTIAHQLRQKIPDISVHIDQAIDSNPDICSKSLGEQFDKLIGKPLQRLDGSLLRPTYVVVVDALDECEKEDDIRTLLQLWSRLGQSPYRYVRWFLTSRPELAIRLGFSRMSTDIRHCVVLHDMPLPTIKHDISVYLADVFAQIRDDYNFAPLSDVPLPKDWPGAVVLKELTQMAVPLFIIAATICRFVQDQDFDPQDQLRLLLQSRKIGQISGLGQTYRPILERVVSPSANLMTRHQVYQEFRLIVGTIVTAAEPLSRLGLSHLLKLPPETIALQLRSLHSILHVPQHAEIPIRPLHLSFAEFLSSEEIRDQPFWIDRAATHAALLSQCLELMSQPHPVGLGENMCKLSYPGQSRRDLAPKDVHRRFPPAMQYACRYWTYHARQSQVQVCDNSNIGLFLQEHFLHWLESLSFLDCLADALVHINTLQSLLVAQYSRCLATFLEDARRFILANRFIIELTPLQVYSSAIVFAPQKSLVRQVCGQMPTWIEQHPITPAVWGAELQKLEGHTAPVRAVAFSDDCSLLASASADWTVRLWNPTTGQELQKLEGHTHFVNAVAFSHDGSLLASASDDKTVRLWNPTTGQEVQELEGHTYLVTAVVFSHDGSLLASASDDWTVGVWNPKTGRELQKLEGHTHFVNAVAFSHDGSLLASASFDETVRLWNPKTGQELQKLDGYTYSVNAVAFSYDDSLLASASDDETVRLWNPTTGRELQKLEGHTAPVRAVAFSYDGSLLASASADETVRLWNPTTGRELQKLEGHTASVTAVAFSHDGSLLASASDDETVRLWNLTTGQVVQKVKGVRSVSNLSFTPDNSTLITNRGHLRINTVYALVLPLDSCVDNGLMLTDDWIEHCGKKLLWLPQEYRSGVSALSGNTFAIGRHNGSVSFLRINYP